MKEQQIFAENRMRVPIWVRVRSPAAEGDAVVAGASTRALRVSMTAPPGRGEIVEVMVGGQSLVGRVRWRIGKRCGIALVEPINVLALLAGEAVPLRLGVSAAAACEPRRPLAAAFASDGPLPARILQAVVMLAILVGGVAWTLHVAALAAEPQETGHPETTKVALANGTEAGN